LVGNEKIANQEALSTTVSTPTLPEKILFAGKFPSSTNPRLATTCSESCVCTDIENSFDDQLMSQPIKNTHASDAYVQRKTVDLHIEHECNANDIFMTHLFSGMALRSTHPQVNKEIMISIVRAGGMIIETDTNGHQRIVAEDHALSCNGHDKSHAEASMLLKLEASFSRMLPEEFMHMAKFHVIVVIIHNRRNEQGSMCNDCYHALESFVLRTNIDIKQTKVVFPKLRGKRGNIASPITSICYMEEYLKSKRQNLGIRFFDSKINNWRKPIPPGQAEDEEIDNSHVGIEVVKYLIKCTNATRSKIKKGIAFNKTSKIL